MSNLRKKFVKDFDEELANSLEIAALSNANGINDESYGSDKFRWALMICIGYQCFEVKEYRDHHGVSNKHSYKKIKRWIIKNANLGKHDGSFDLLGAMVGCYDGYT